MTMLTDPKQLVIKVYEALAKGDRQRLQDLMAPEVQWSDNAPPEMRGGGTFFGIDAIIKYVASNIGETTTFKIEREWMVSEENRVVVLIHETARVQRTKRMFEIFSIHVFTFVDGKVVKFENFFDPTPILKATYDITYTEAEALAE
ncbi:MAG: nuclear transport factor 2 family protein [Candidatus Thiodiazotropha sp. (ex Dulcina madagascariensis)]|nr:nuclear transport factor 2 family protein [Candidatus Thiodiazotropha sp. (ex Dulcina madagascariensis)]